MNYRRFKNEALQMQCRDCINEKHGFRLKREDCVYLVYPTACSCCGQVRNIVIDVAPLRRWKIWLKQAT